MWVVALILAIGLLYTVRSNGKLRKEKKEIDKKHKAAAKKLVSINAEFIEFRENSISSVDVQLLAGKIQRKFGPEARQTVIDHFSKKLKL